MPAAVFWHKTMFNIFTDHLWKGTKRRRRSLFLFWRRRLKNWERPLDGRLRWTASAWQTAPFRLSKAVRAHLSLFCAFMHLMLHVCLLNNEAAASFDEADITHAPLGATCPCDCPCALGGSTLVQNLFLTGHCYDLDFQVEFRLSEIKVESFP